MTTPMQDRLRHCARHTGLDAVAELLNEAADAFDREVEARKQAQAQSEDYKAALTKAEHQIERLQAAQDAEPFGYFRAEPFGWTNCAQTDEGAIALYEHPAAIDAARKDTE